MINRKLKSYKNGKQTRVLIKDTKLWKSSQEKYYLNFSYDLIKELNHKKIFAYWHYKKRKSIFAH